MNLIVYAVLAIAVMGMIGTGVYKVKQWGAEEVRTEWTDANAKAQKQADAKAKADRESKEKADAENAAAVDKLMSDIRRVRDERDRRRPSVVPTTAACSASPEAIERYAAEYQSAYRDLVAGLREQGNRGSKAVTDLNTAKEWAR